jgi:hypothetical protein
LREVVRMVRPQTGEGRRGGRSIVRSSNWNGAVTSPLLEAVSLDILLVIGIARAFELEGYEVV